MAAGLGLATGDGDADGEGDAEGEGEGEEVVVVLELAAELDPPAKKLELRPVGRAAREVAAEVMPG